jgi:AraC-like DNA-binding protein
MRRRSDYRPQQVRFSFSRPASIDYEAVFGCPVHFDQGADEVAVSAEWLARPTRRSDPVTFENVAHMCDRLLRRPESSQDGVAGDLRRMMLGANGRLPTIEEAAGRIGMSARTLRRRLVAEGSSYAGVVSEVRATLAKAYLRDTPLPIGEVAELVGYGDVSNFRNAFLKWTGATPTQYRRATCLAKIDNEAEAPPLWTNPRDERAGALT